ncbi:aminoglycoside phosphotransferase family protein [Cellulomonas chengniuliangii]|uniref:Aminoglycoside phosphotransferase family protein n=1 Tax=Cellulomonas chengniuliangii TaxID=2968084 RepID=A0ABY5L3W8_9CELL|nr:aminoglycoside phosphotransferase family protein [Cellulomonas chengniuliangii]MCC2308154.1 aminoglycoside phosphotransferase family protein [Cellulomonas chengniuliangii]UUI76548.1 aminoglycoside phosphotransferase family protein [Cellulomonas chengniuliangii]
MAPAIDPVLTIPTILHDGIGRTPAGAEWLAALPRLVEAAARRWGLAVGEPFQDGSAAWTAPARTPEGRAVVLKVVMPHDEARHEAAVLRAWQGHGAVTLVAHDPGDWALLLEQVVPGTPMTASTTPAAELLGAAAAVHRALLAAPVVGLADLPAMADVCRAWSEGLTDRAGRAAAEGDLDLDGTLVERAHHLLDELPGTTGHHAVVHGDLNPGNLLLGLDGEWVAIDPKPMVGDPAYDLWPLLEQVDPPFRAADPARLLRERTALLSDRTGLDPRRVAGWALARSVESALWRWDRLGDIAGAQRELDRSAVWAALA